MFKHEHLLHQKAHPLAVSLAQRTHRAPALLVGIGSGRNLPPFLDDAVVYITESSSASLPWETASVGRLLSTHTLQHGTWATLRAHLAEFTRVCANEAIIALVFASTRDARFARGRYCGPQCYAPTGGEEQGVPHLYVTEPQIREHLTPHFDIEAIEEINADQIVGTWAHAQPSGLWHYFVTAIRRR